MSFYPVSDYLALPRNAVSWVVEDILPTGGLLNIYGKPKSHKSFLALQIAQAVADPNIKEVAGFPVHQHGKVAYLQVDTPRGLWADRLIRWFPDMQQGVALADAEVVPYPFNILGDGFKWLKDSVAACQPLVVFIDTLREIHIGDENDSSHMQLVVNTLASACKPAAVVMLSHARKNSAEGGFALMDENRGSGYVAGRMDAVVYLSKEKLTYQTRTAKLDSFEIFRTPLVQLKDPVSVMAARLAATPGLTMPQMIATLRARFPSITQDAARGQLRRAQEGEG